MFWKGIRSVSRRATNRHARQRLSIVEYVAADDWSDYLLSFWLNRRTHKLPRGARQLRFATRGNGTWHYSPKIWTSAHGRRRRRFIGYEPTRFMRAVAKRTLR